MQFLHIPCAWKGMPVLPAPQHKAGVTSAHLVLKLLITQAGRNSQIHHHHHFALRKPHAVALPAKVSLKVSHTLGKHAAPTALGLFS